MGGVAWECGRWMREVCWEARYCRDCCTRWSCCEDDTGEDDSPTGSMSLPMRWRRTTTAVLSPSIDCCSMDQTLLVLLLDSRQAARVYAVVAGEALWCKDPGVADLLPKPTLPN